jgi:hypothetical protein
MFGTINNNDSVTSEVFLVKALLDKHLKCTYDMESLRPRSGPYRLSPPLRSAVCSAQPPSEHDLLRRRILGAHMTNMNSSLFRFHL